MNRPHKPSRVDAWNELWKGFWDGLNIRKVIVIVLLTCLVYSLHVHATIDSTIKDMTLMAISYYLGYSNGKPDSKK
jgi:hypothetical protein